jgi:hypothetical protein
MIDLLGDEVLPKKRKARSKKKARERYGIAEWYGKDISSMSPEERKSLALISMSKDTDKPDCPFQSSIGIKKSCSKPGGVCTLRKYQETTTGDATALVSHPIVTICPVRFLGRSANGAHPLGWVGDKMGVRRNAIIVKETPFLKTLIAKKIAPHLQNNEETDDEDEDGKKAGRIDWILVERGSETNPEPRWCALETQAVYFSGKAMEAEFEPYVSNPERVHFPAINRRPDYRSSGPKRLAPQLDVKVPVLRGWGVKLAVLIDRYFFECMYDLPHAYSSGSDLDKLDNCEVAWFVVDYDEQMKLTFSHYQYSTLDGSIKALNATAPMSKQDFYASLKLLLSNQHKKGSKVFHELAAEA